MKRHYITGAAIIAASIAIYPLMKHLAFMERGYHAHGGETLLLICGIGIGIAVIIQGIQNTLLGKEGEPVQYKTCGNCGANLDPEEVCDCEETKGSLPEDKLPLTESEQSYNHFDANSLYHGQTDSVN